MQAVMTEAAHGRIAGRLAALAPDLDVLLVTGQNLFLRGEEAVPPEAVDPDIIWCSLDAYPGPYLGTLFRTAVHAPRKPWMQAFNAGLDNPVFKAIMANGVRITKSSAQSVPIAEYVLAHAISLIVPLGPQAEAQAAKTWTRTPYREVSQSRWTLVGFGPIGRAIAVRAKAFGAHVTVVRRSVKDDPAVDAVVTMAALPDLLPEIDVIVLACPLNDETQGMANAAFFKALKPGAILINIGRGGLVDEDALRVGLSTQQPGHAVLDVFQTEPLPDDSWLWSHPQVRVSAHTSNSGGGTLQRGDELFLANLKHFLAGEPLINEAHPSEVGL
jgi:phosphoglycerate dehydrogenase-like enzyme